MFHSARNNSTAALQAPHRAGPVASDLPRSAGGNGPLEAPHSQAATRRRARWQVLRMGSLLGMVIAIIAVDLSINQVISGGYGCAENGGSPTARSCYDGTLTINVAVWGGLVALLAHVSASCRLRTRPLLSYVWATLFAIIGCTFVGSALNSGALGGDPVSLGLGSGFVVLGVLPILLRWLWHRHKPATPVPARG